MGRRAALLLAAAAVFLLAGAGGISAYAYGSLRRSVDEVLARRLEAVGATAARLVALLGPAGLARSNRSDMALDAALRDVARANELDGAYVFDAQLRVTADAYGRTGRSVNLMRIDPDRASAALAGHPSVGWAFSVEGLRFLGGYFPVTDAPRTALAVEAGEAFTAPSRRLRAAAVAIFVIESALGLLSLVVLFFAVRSATRERQAYGRAERAGIVTRMAATVAHEVRNPLGIIRGAAELLRERAMTDADRELTDDVLGEVQRLNALTEEFLDLAREQPLRSGPIDVAALISETCDRLRLAYPALSIELAADTADTVKKGGAPPTIVGDEPKLRQVLLNLFVNAAQATDGRGRVRVETSCDGRGVRIAVADDGPGVSPSVLPQLFEPFVTGKAHGSGLGLALARRIVAQHGGQLVLRPSPAGARFEAWLPFSSAPGPIAKAPPAIAKAPWQKS